MQVENRKDEVPFAYYQEKFAALDPAEAVSRVGECYKDGKFSLALLGSSYTVTHPQAVITPAAALPVQTFLLRWLLEGDSQRDDGNYYTFRELPWGEVYIQAYTGRVLKRSAFTFGTRLLSFAAACEKMGAEKLPAGDCGYRFSFLPGLKMQLIIWEGDEEFPPSAQILYSGGFAGLTAEDRVIAAEILISTVKANMQ